MSVFFLAIGILVGIAGWILHPWFIRYELDRQITWSGKQGKPSSHYKHFSHKSAVECLIPAAREEATLASKLAEMIVSPPNTPTKPIITNRTADQIAFENPKLVVWPGHAGSYRSKELGFSQGHFHLRKNGKALVTYELDFSKLWQRARIMAYVNLIIWGTFQVVAPVATWFILRKYPQSQNLSIFSVYLIIFSWTPYWPLVVFRKLRMVSCQVIEQIIGIA